MFLNKPSLIPALIGSLVISVATVGIYHVWKGRCSNQDAQRLMIQESVSELIKQKPDLFLGAINEAALQQQEKMRTDMEKNATDMKSKLVEASINFGSTEEGNVRFIAFLDPMCPHCNEFLKITFHVLKKSPHVGFHVIPVAILGQNSEAMAKFMIAGANQSVEKLKVFEQKFIDNIADINRQKLLEFAKSSGFDLARLEKDELSEETEKVINRNGNLAEELKIQGVPTVYVIMPDDKLSLVPPMSLDGFMALVDDLQSKFKVGEKPHNVEAPKPVTEVKGNDSKAKETPKEAAKTASIKQAATPAPKEEPKVDAIKAETTSKVEEVKPESSKPEAPQVVTDKPAENKDEKKS